MPDITYDVGRVSFIMKGAWNLATAYEKLDAVTHDGSLYIAKQNVPGWTAITNTTYWVLAVEKGDQGETGNGIASIAKTGTAGNVDTYTITYTDGTTTTFTVTNGGVTTVNGRTGDVTGLAEEDGNYPLLNAGTADNLTPYSADSGATQDIPFINEATGGGNGASVVDTGSYMQAKKKLGNTVAVNQLVPIPSASVSATQNGVTFTDNRDGTYTVVTDAGGATADTNFPISSLSIPKGRTVIINGSFSNSSVSTHRWFFSSSGTNTYFNNGDGIYTIADNTVNFRFSVRAGDVISTPQTRRVTISDLDIWYGSPSAIPSDLLSHPENWGRYYAGSLAYAAGYLDSADGTVLKSIGRNIFNKATSVDGERFNASGTTSESSSNSRSDYIPVIGGTSYYFKDVIGASQYSAVWWFDINKNYISANSFPGSDTGSGYATAPANAAFVGVNMRKAYKDSVTVSLYYPGESGYDQYYPYTVLAEVDTGSEALRSAGSVADEKTPDGTITRRVGVVDLGTLNWSAISRNRFETSSPISGLKYNPSAIQLSNIHCGRYEIVTFYTIYQTDTDKCISVYNESAYIQVRDTSYATAAAFKTAMSGVYLYYELATPTTEQGTAFAENIPCDDFGSLMWTQTKGIPQGVEIFYPVDYKASIDTLYNRVEGDMGKIVIDSELGAVADRIPTAPDTDGTYTLKATVSSGTKTYSWVADE